MTSAKTVTEVEITAVVIRADGTKVDLGQIAYWHRNPIKRALFALKQAFSRKD